MTMSSRSRWGSKSAMTLSTTAVGTMSQTARGWAKLLAKCASDVVPTAFSLTSSATAFADLLYTTHW